MTATSLDYYGIEELLTEEERAARDRARRFVQEEVLPEIVPCHRAAKFPDTSHTAHGCVGLLCAVSERSTAVLVLATPRTASLCRSLNVPIRVCARWCLCKARSRFRRFIPSAHRSNRRAGCRDWYRATLVGCFALTEHGHGSDPGGMETRARRDGDHYILNGSKCWIGNASIADVKVVWAKDDDGRVGGFVVEKDAPGFRAQDIEGKFSLRMSRTSECWFENCRIPAENRLAKASGLGAPLSCLSHARAGIAWGVIGAAIDCYETALAYAKSREQFGRPIAGFQLVQQKLVWMAQEITKAQLLALRLTRMMEMGSARPAQISLAKRNNVWMALECARKARDILGAAGITDRYSVIRHLMNLESVSTYEGTHDIHTLIVGRDITGIDAFGG